MATQPRMGKIVYDVKSFFSSSSAVFVAKGRKYVRLQDPSICRCVAVAANGRHVDMEPLWSQKETDEPMQLEAFVVREVVPETMAVEYLKGTNRMVRSYRILTQSSQENPRELILENLPPDSWITINTMFPEKGSLKKLSGIAFDKLNRYDTHAPLDVPLFPNSDAEAVGEKKKSPGAAATVGGDAGLYTTEEDDDDAYIRRPKKKMKGKENFSPEI